VIGAVKKKVDVRPIISQAARNLPMDLPDVVEPVVTPRDTSLIRHHRNRDVGTVKRGDRFRRSFDELDAVDRPDIATVDNDRAIAIKKDSRARTRCQCATNQLAF